MKAVDIYSLAPIKTETEDLHSLLLMDGAATNLFVPGCFLEAQFVDTAGALLFVTHNIPFEEILEILLIANDAKLADRASLWGAYTTGNFRDAVISGTNSVDFSFFGHRRWRVRLLKRPEFRLPIFSGEPLGVHRPFGWSRRMVIQ
jgi:hypothetical protein